MATETRKYTPEENKARRVKAATEQRDAQAKKLERAEAKVTEAQNLQTKADEARKALNKAEKHLEWVKSMPIGDEDEAPAVEDGDGPQNVLDAI